MKLLGRDVSYTCHKQSRDFSGLSRGFVNKQEDERSKEVEEGEERETRNIGGGINCLVKLLRTSVTPL